MITKVSALYFDKIKNLAEVFARRRASLFQDKSYRKVYNSTKKIYEELSLFLYIRLNKISRNKTKFNFNRISSYELKKFSCKLYKEILLDLEHNNIIVINNHYLNHPKYYFSKSFLIHRNLIHKIDESKQRFDYKLISVDVSKRILDILGHSEIENKDDDFSFSKKLNRYYRETENEKNILDSTFYKTIKYDEESLDKYCGEDEFLFNEMKKKLRRMNLSPKKVKSRYYHVFHEFSKEFREEVLRFEGEKIREVFDVSGSDLHMLAKHLESENIPIQELIKFQKEVKLDIRKKFGVKKNGKCTEYVKRAFKVFLNSKKYRYNSFREESLVKRIDEYFKDHFPTIREYIVEHEDIWQISMNEEFDIISNKMFNYFNERGIHCITCHDAIYMKASERHDNIENIFYDKLDLFVDRIEKLNNL